MEPLVQHLRTQAHEPASVQQIAIDGKNFEIPAEQAIVIKTVANGFRDCGSRDGTFLAAPYYPGLYAFLNTRAPNWDTFFLWPRTRQLQQLEIKDVEKHGLALVLLNTQAAMNGRESLKLAATNPELVEYVISNFQPSG